MRVSDPSETGAAASARKKQAEIARLALDNPFAISPDAIFVSDSGGRICEANPRAIEMFGYTQAEFLGMCIDELVPDRFRQRHPGHRENYNAHPRLRAMGADLNLFARRKDGVEFPVDIMLRPVGTASGPAVVSFVRDATEQRAAAEELRRKDLQLRQMLASVQDYAIYMLDRDGSIMTWNPGAERIKQYSADEILGLHFSRFFTQQDLDRGHPAELLQLAAEHGRVEEEGWRVRKDGSRFWAHISLTAMRDDGGQLVGYTKVTRDFTDRRRAEEAVMLQLSSVLLANMDAGRLLAAVSASVREVLPHDLATLALYDTASKDLPTLFLGQDESNSRPSEVRVPLDGSPAGSAFRKRQPVLLSAFSRSEFEPSTLTHLTSLGMQSGCWVPLVHRGEPIGTMAVSSRSEEAFSRRNAEMLTEIASHVAMAVNNARAFRHVSESRDRLNQEKQYLEAEINLENRYEDIVGESGGLRQVLQQIETVAPTDATVLIQGETGTGKELLARAIHRLSTRKQRTFVKLNCAAIPAGLLESELFGHEKGAFTGAIARKIGRLELAHEGTLFLDEIGELPLDLQPKLLRALQEREIERLGSNRPIPINVRLIAATNRNLAAMVAQREFRSDLYYRLKVFPIFAPPLRERAGDIPILVRHFVSMHSRRMSKTIHTIPDEAMQALVQWKWPGNIRELENFLERAVILTRGPVLHVPLGELAAEDEQEPDAATESTTLHEADRDLIVRALRETRGQIGGPDGAAARLGLKRTTLNSKIKKLGIMRSDYM